LHLDKANHQELRWKVRIYAGEKLGTLKIYSIKMRKLYL